MKFPCYGARCRKCVYNPKRYARKAVLVSPCDTQPQMVRVDVKPTGVKLDGRRYWRF
jgi:hypothetical protein